MPTGGARALRPASSSGAVHLRQGRALGEQLSRVLSEPCVKSARFGPVGLLSKGFEVAKEIQKLHDIWRRYRDDLSCPEYQEKPEFLAEEGPRVETCSDVRTLRPFLAWHSW